MLTAKCSDKHIENSKNHKKVILFSQGHVTKFLIVEKFGTGHPIHFVFGSSTGFLGSAD